MKFIFLTMIDLLMTKQTTLLIALTLFLGVRARPQQLRAPSYPLITVDPYFSIWSANDTLTGGPTRHWTGKENSLQGIIRIDGHPYYFLGQPITEWRTVLPLTGKTGSWDFTETKPVAGWEQPGFEEAGWKHARGAFSDNARAPNKWASHDLWTRRTFQLQDTRFDHLMLNLHHDDNIEVYLNGVLAYKATGWNDAPTAVELPDDARAALKKGTNVLAIHVENTAGGAYLDAGLIDESLPKTVIPAMTQTSVRTSATQTFYTFRGAGVTLDLTFTDPLLPGDLDLYSRPADYISFKVHSGDGNAHQVQLYFSAAGNIAVNTPDQQVTWKRAKAGNLDLLRVGTVSQQVLVRKGDNVRIDWGYLYLAVPRDGGTTTLMSSSAASVEAFAKTGRLSGADDTGGPRAAGTSPLTLAAAYDLGAVKTAPVSRHVILAYDDLYAIEYFHQKLKAWWKRKGMTTVQMLTAAAKDYTTVLDQCDRFDKQLLGDALHAGGADYAKICALAYRQTMAACKLAAGPGGQPLFFTKENFSNGDISTVDVIFPGSPVLLMYQPALVKAVLDPIFYYVESGQWPAPYSPHDLGTYPVANGRKVEEGMPIEESGNMLILAAALSRDEGNAEYASKHWAALSKWAGYLLKYGMDPEDQLCTDDFAGPSAHNANLSVKAIMGIACYGEMARMLGKSTIARQYLDTARKMAAQWVTMARDGDHYKLAFDNPGSWSQKYNLVWDKMLQLHIFPSSVAGDEIKFYLTKQRRYGLPLDSRKTYTKADWITWTATLADNRKDFEALIHPLYEYINETPTRVPISDWYETTNAKQVGFQARSVVGGFFIKALDWKWNHKNK